MSRMESLLNFLDFVSVPGCCLCVCLLFKYLPYEVLRKVLLARITVGHAYFSDPITNSIPTSILPQIFLVF